jgi:RNA polymerase sigma-70 factor, ECF subfamily
VESLAVSQSATQAADAELIAELRAGNEGAFERLIGQNHAGVVRLAQHYVHDRATAEDVAQEAWIGVLRGLDRFESRSSLRTWIYGIALNTAASRARSQRRTIAFSAVPAGQDEGFEPAVEPSRFRGRNEPYPGGWSAFPPSWGDAPEQRLLSAEVRQHIYAALDTLPIGQRTVVTLRDIDGLSAAETCNVLGLSESNQRVLLHRGRSKLRRAIERYLTRQ